MNHSLSTYLHDESFERDPLIVISVIVVEFEVIMKYQCRLHIKGHLQSHCAGSWDKEKLVLIFIFQIECLGS